MEAKTIDEVITLLGEIIDTSKASQSPLGYFPALYRKVTIQIKEHLHTGYFDDDARMEQLDVIFANRYLNAYGYWQKKQDITDAWLKTFEFSQNNRLIVLQHLLLGMNAHINLDLGIAAAAISDAQTIGSLQDDFNRINEILAALVDDVQQDLIEVWPTLFWILKRLNGVDQQIADFSMKMARDHAWMFATQLVQIPQIDQTSLIHQKDQEAAALTKLVVPKKLINRFAFRMIRLFERGSVAKKIEALAG